MRVENPHYEEPKKHDPNLQELSEKYEHYETDLWAVERLFEVEPVGLNVVDPCTGTGILAEEAEKRGCIVDAFDIHNWGYKKGLYNFDYLTDKVLVPECVEGATVLMNPPFSLATDFVKRSLDLGAPKVICFQRFSWYEAEKRREFWDDNEPARIWLCGSRAVCWRHDLLKNEKGERFDPVTNKKLKGAPTAHAWFIWTQQKTEKPVVGRIYK